MEAALAGVVGGLGTLATGLIAILVRTGRKNGTQAIDFIAVATENKVLLEGMREAMKDHHDNGQEMLIELTKISTILDDRLPRGG